MAKKRIEAADSETMSFIKRVVRDRRPELLNVSISAILIYGANGKPAMPGKDGKVLAKIQKTSAADARRGMPWLKLSLDGDHWSGCTGRQQEAIVFHELCHVVYDGDDDDGQPILSLRGHDWHVTGFEDVAKQFGDDSPEKLIAADFAERYGQLLMWPEAATAAA